VRKQRRRFAILALAPLTGMVVAVACGFPNPAIEGEDGGGVPGIDSGNDTATGSDANDAQTANDAFVFDAGEDVKITTDAGSKIDADSCDATSNCDCDKDGYHHVTVANGIACDASAAQGNVDCDDYDTRYRPNQDFVDLPTNRPDWNCNTVIEKSTAINNVCGTITNLLQCSGKQGFRGDPDCGIEDPYVFCAKGGLAGLDCVEGNVQTRKQACR